MRETVPATEVEAKFLLPGAQALRAIAALSEIDGFELSRRDSVNLETVYYDTTDLALARHAVALRTRRSRGQWEATAKWSGRRREAVYERPELTVPLPAGPGETFSLPPGPLEVRLAALVAGRPLLPLLRTRIRRTRLDVRLAGGDESADPLAEIDLDVVRIDPVRPPTPVRRGSVSTSARPPDPCRFHEIEIELRSGTHHDLDRLAAALQSRFPLTASSESKLTTGLTVFFPRVQPSAAREFSAISSVDEALRAVVAEQLARLRDNDPGVRIGEDPEAVHDMRVASRRLRAALQTFRGATAERIWKPLNEDLRWLRRALGEVRDLDVQLGLARDAADQIGDPQSAALSLLTQHLIGRRDEARAVLLRDLSSTRYFRLLRRLEALCRPRRSPPRAAEGPTIAQAGRHEIERRFARLCKKGDALGDLPAPEDLHALRIRAKKLRYTLEFLRPISGKAGQRLIEDLVELQDLLGEHHDRIVAADSVRAFGRATGSELTVDDLIDLGAHRGYHLIRVARLVSRYRRTWKRFRRPHARRDYEKTLAALSRVSPSPA